MRTAFGWTLLSREALKEAEAHLREETQGVRDEVGFLALHQAYADRFFPGTSVLHTRLRYVLFVPWIYERLAARPRLERADRLVEQEEIQLAGRLKKSQAEGVIGGRTYPEPTSQPPTMVYWTALGTWGILRPVLGQLPSRAALHQAFSRRQPASRQTDDDQQPLEPGQHPFGTLPRPPKSWEEIGKPLTFNLEESEQVYLLQRLSAVVRDGEAVRQSLIARLAERATDPGNSEFPWDATIAAAADHEDRAALSRASKVAALSAIGRAIYAAIVEELRESDGLATPRRHRDHLKTIVAKYKRAALSLAPDELPDDVEYLRGRAILEIVKASQKWLKGSGSYMQLREEYATAEQTRKGPRARLPHSLSARNKRAEWDADEHPEAAPLHFRWGVVQRLLQDLRGEP